VLEAFSQASHLALCWEIISHILYLMRSVEDILALMGGAETAAATCQVGTEAIRKWRQARAIPARHWAAVMRATGLPLDALPGAPAAEPRQIQEAPMPHTPPEGATAALVLDDGSVFWGRGFGAHGTQVAEICFNTGMTGYQETLTDPSYAAQIIAFTFPHIGNVGTNPEDMEAANPVCRGLVVKQDVTEPANYRATAHLQDWLKRHDIPGIAGVDTRALTIRIRDGGPPNGVIAHPADGVFDIPALVAQAKSWPGLEGMDLAREVTARQSYAWDGTRWSWGTGFGRQEAPRFRVVALDYGAKRNILRCLADAGCAVTVLPATATAEDILREKPDGVFLSNGPGDPAATGAYMPCLPSGRCWRRAFPPSASASATSCWPWRSARAPTSSIAGTGAPTSPCRTWPPARSRSPARTTASRWMPRRCRRPRR